MYYTEIIIPRKVSPSEVGQVISGVTECWELPRETPYQETLTPDIDPADTDPDFDCVQEWKFNGSEYGFTATLWDSCRTFGEEYLSPVFAYFGSTDLFIIVIEAPSMQDDLFKQVVLALHTHFGGIVDVNGEIIDAILNGNAVNKEKYLHYYL